MELGTKFKTIKLVFTTRKIVNITNILKGKNFEDLYFKVVNESNLDALSKIIYIFAEDEAGIKSFKTSEEVYEFLDDYKEETGKDVQVLLLQNHGIFVAADTVEEIGVLFDSVIEKLEKQVKRTADVSNAVTPEKEQAAEKLSRLLGHRVEVVPAAEADNFVKDKTAAAPLLKPFTPDHIVYCGPYPLFVENIDEAKSALDAFMAENDKEPRLILVQGVGAFIMEDDKGKAAKAQLLVKDAIKLAVYAESFGGPLQMTDEITYFITHWEAEAYRSKK